MRRFIFPKMFDPKAPKVESHGYEVPDDIEARILLMGARELQVLQLTCSGWSRLEISERLKIEPGTVGCHLKKACGRMDVQNLYQMMIVAFELGWIETKAIRLAHEAEIERLAKLSADNSELRSLRT